MSEVSEENGNSMEEKEQRVKISESHQSEEHEIDSTENNSENAVDVKIQAVEEKNEEDVDSLEKSSENSTIESVSSSPEISVEGVESGEVVQTSERNENEEIDKPTVSETEDNKEKQNLEEGEEKKEQTLVEKTGFQRKKSHPRGYDLKNYRDSQPNPQLRRSFRKKRGYRGRKRKRGRGGRNKDISQDRDRDLVQVGSFKPMDVNEEYMEKTPRGNYIDPGTYRGRGPQYFGNNYGYGFKRRRGGRRFRGRGRGRRGRSNWAMGRSYRRRGGDNYSGGNEGTQFKRYSEISKESTESTPISDENHIQTRTQNGGDLKDLEGLRKENKTPPATNSDQYENQYQQDDRFFFVRSAQGQGKDGLQRNQSQKEFFTPGHNNNSIFAGSPPFQRTPSPVGINQFITPSPVVGEKENSDDGTSGNFFSVFQPMKLSHDRGNNGDVNRIRTTPGFNSSGASSWDRNTSPTFDKTGKRDGKKAMDFSLNVDAAPFVPKTIVNIDDKKV